MKYFTLLVFIGLMPILGFSQTTIFDFEGTAPTFNDFNGSTTQVIDNPDASGINTSSKVAENTVPANAAFAGVNIPDQNVDISADKGFSMQVWSPMTNVPVLLKLEGAVNAERQAMFTAAAGEWQELTFDFSSEGALVFTSVTVFMNFNVVAADDMVFYWDNLEQFTVAPPMEPLTAAPNPDEDAADVISMFSDAYDDVTVDTWLTNWSAANLEDIEIESNPTKLYTSLNFAGIETLGDNAIDLETAEMTHLHLDVWTPNSTAFRIKLVDFGGDGFGNGNDSETELSFALDQAQWVSLDIPLTDFIMNQSDISQFIISSDPAGSSTIYLDNIYYYKEVVLTGDQMDLPVTFDDPDVLYSLIDFGGAASEIIDDATSPGNNVVQSTKTAGAEPWAGTTLSENMGGSPNDPGFATAIPFSEEATIISVRVWAPAADVPVRLKVESSVDAGVSVETQTNTTVANDWEVVEFEFKNNVDGTPALDFNASYDKLSIFFDFGTSPMEDVVYFWDDVIFTGTTTVDDEPAPMVAAPDPDEDPSLVISMYSDVYTDVAVDTWLTSWSAANLEDIEIEGNPTKKYSALDFAGIETLGANAINLEAAEMTHLHVDIWTPNSETFRIKLVDFGMDGFGGDNDTEFEIPFEGLAQEEWVGLDIPLMDFMDMNQSDISQFIISSLPPGTSTIYLDNIYYYNDSPNNTTAPVYGQLEVYPNPSNDQFRITAPALMDQIILYAASGKIVGKWQPHTETYQLDANPLASGVYIALVNSNGKLYTTKLIKE
ncbi:MAG: T9SS type A sorting domain-containing protein [Chitinophagales bacterium]|nr:T9SS type A sorting domain-containing protein [Chitinophagales bacterium]